MPVVATDPPATGDDDRCGDHAIGRVVGLYVAARGGEPVRGHDVVDVLPGLGVVGDRYATRTGHWSDPRWPDQELTLVEEEVADSLGVAAPLLRRNIVTRGVRLHELIGTRFRIGAVEARGVRVCDPCRHLEQLLGRPGLARDLAAAGGGLRADVLTPGRIAIGDPVAATDLRATDREHG
jgi:MOSC domain-containing protein YiiM